MTTPPFVHLDDLELHGEAHGERFASANTSIGALLGLKGLGCRLSEVPPGKAAWPRHAHLVNDELVLILAGRGRLRYGEGEYTVTTGDVLGFPSGDPAAAHQIINDGEVALRYLCVSTQQAPDIAIYPDSGKFFVVAGSAPGGDKAARTFAHVGLLADAVDYWAGESD